MDEMFDDGKMQAGPRDGGRGRAATLAAALAIALAGLAGAYFDILSHVSSAASSASAATPTTTAPLTADSVDLNQEELKTVKIEEIGERVFTITRSTIGNIDFNQDNSLQVFTPYPGRITR